MDSLQETGEEYLLNENIITRFDYPDYYACEDDSAYYTVNEKIDQYKNEAALTSWYFDQLPTLCSAYDTFLKETQTPALNGFSYP